VALAYLDTSALAKRYVPEVGSAWVARLCQQEPVAISLVAIAEMASALSRRAREGALSAQLRDTLFRAFVRDARSFALIEPSQVIAQQAATLLLTAQPAVRLRTLDALHVASAQVAFARARRRGVATGSFVTADRALIDAATWAGLAVRNPEVEA
jgi:predicted nucleic acid-binding protein